MASIRRTLSPVPQARAINGEAHSVPSPLSKSSNTNTIQSHIPSGGLLTRILGLMESNPVLYRLQAVLLGIFTHRSSRSLERSKSKVSFWRRAIFNIFIFFSIGIFFGFMPLFSNFSENLMSMNQTFSFDAIPVSGNVIQHDGTLKGRKELLGNFLSKENSSSEILADKQDVVNEISDVNTTTKLTVEDSNFVYRKLLIIVTPTFPRPFQAYYLNRLAQTLKLVEAPLLWIVVEMPSQSPETADILRKTRVMYRHLVCDENTTTIRNRGLHQRNVALSHIERHHLDGIVYFADDNNVYSLELFEQMRKISRFGTWPVAMLTNSKSKATVVAPVCKASQVTGWHTTDRNRRLRRFHSHISGLAFNSTILWDPKRWHRLMLEPIRQLHKVKEVVQVSTFVEQLVEDETQMEGLPEDCSRIMVWHLPLEASLSMYPSQWLMKKNLDVISPLT